MQAQAAAAQGKFWDMHDALFEQQRELMDPRDLAVLGDSLGLDSGRLRDELQAGRHRPRVQADLARGERDGADRTPTFFINGVRYRGDSDKESLEAALRAELAR